MNSLGNNLPPPADTPLLLSLPAVSFEQSINTPFGYSGACVLLRGGNVYVRTQSTEQKEKEEVDPVLSSSRVSPPPSEPKQDGDIPWV